MSSLIARGSDRKQLFKKQNDSENGRRRREETTTQLRKSKKEDQLMKRRQLMQAAPTVDNNGPTAGKEMDENCSKEDIPRLMDIFRRCQSGDELLQAVKGFRRMLSVETDPPVDEVIQSGALPYLISYLRQQENPMMVFESAWALTNIASTDRTREVFEAGATPSLIHLLGHEKPEIREQAAWCLGNIAGDCYELRNQVLELGALPGLLTNMNQPGSMTLLSNVTWTVSNLCRGKPSPVRELIEPAIAPLALLLTRDVSQEVVVDAVWALSYLADGDNERIEMVMDTNITSKLISYLAQNYAPLMTPVVRCLGNFVTGTDVQTQMVLDAGITGHAVKLLNHPSKNIRKETCWLLSNIGAGTAQQVGTLFQEGGLLDKLVELGRNERWDIRREAIWVLSNIFTTGTDFHVRGLVQRDGLQAITEALGVKDPKIITVALEAVEKILAVGEKLSLGYTTLMDEYHGIDAIENLQEHPNEEVYEKAVEILERFFGIEEEEDENLAPAQHDGTYGFGIAPPPKQLFPDAENNASSAHTVLSSNYEMDM